MSASDSHPMLAPLQLGAIALPNRVVLASPLRCQATRGGVPTPRCASEYAEQAGAGLLITEPVWVKPLGAAVLNSPGMHTDEQQAAWRQLATAVHEAGGRVALKLFHAGRVSHPHVQPHGGWPVAPSAISCPGRIETPYGARHYPVPRALAAVELATIALAFAAAADRARGAGFEAVEIEAGGGYLIDQFLRDSSNRRTDAYGGPVANRARFLIEVVEAVARIIGPERVGVRISPWDSQHDMRDSDPRGTFVHVAHALSQYGLAWLHVAEPEGVPSMAAELRSAFGGPVILGGARDVLSATLALRRRAADAVAFGPAISADPELSARLRPGGAEAGIPGSPPSLALAP